MATEGTGKKTALALLVALKQCGKRGDLQCGKALHLDAIESGYHSDKYIATALITMYTRCGSIESARQVFDGMPHRNRVAWNSLIMGYANRGDAQQVFELFKHMQGQLCIPDAYTYVALLKACSWLASQEETEEVGGRPVKLRCLDKVMGIHSQVRAAGIEGIFVGNALVDIYRKCGSMFQARVVFDNMVCHDSVSWTSLVLGYVENAEGPIAMELLVGLDCEPDCVAFVAALKACACLASDKEVQRQCLEKGAAIHRQARERGLDREVALANTLIDMYSKCADMSHAREVFDNMIQRSVVSWNTLILGYVENGKSSMSLEVFSTMDSEPDYITYVGILKACGSLVAVIPGRAIHTRICRMVLEDNQVVVNSLVDFYCKCGDMYNAEYVFGGMHTPDIVTWNALIAGYGSLGDTVYIYSLVNRIHESGLRINGVTLLLILSACSHGGMVDDATKCLYRIPCKYGINTAMEHYTCIVDMLGRANRLQEALFIIRSMPFQADSAIWTTLICACRSFGNLEVGKVAFDALVALNTKDAYAYVVMRDIYRKLGMLQEDITSEVSG